MALSGLIPDTLPAWMYHAQTPPPERSFKPEIAGLTWVDLVFPFFLFAMGAAIPLAMQKFVSKQSSNLEVVRNLFGRWLMLALFAILSQHLRLYVLAESPTSGTAIWSLVGLAAILLIFAQKIPSPIRIAGGLISLGFLAFWKYPNSQLGFINWRIDIILMVLGNVAFSGGLIWWFTREKPERRWFVAAVVAALFLAKSHPGWIQDLWTFDLIKLLKPSMGSDFDRIPVIYNMEFHKYLLIVIPGMWIGEQLKGIASTEQEKAPMLFPISLVTITLNCFFLTERQWLPAAFTTLVGVFLISKLVGESWKPVVSFASALLLLGFILEPINGGIHKDPSHLSYYFMTSGLATVALIGLYQLQGKLSVWIADCGSNPILAYALIANFLPGFNTLTQYGAYAGQWFTNPWLLALMDGGAKTALIAALAAIATRKKFFLRA